MIKLELTKKEYKKLYKESPMTIFRAHQITVIDKKGNRTVMKNRLLHSACSSGKMKVARQGHMRQLKDGSYVYVAPVVKRDYLKSEDKEAK